MWRVRLNSVRTATLDIMHSATEEAAFLLLLVEVYCSIIFLQCGKFNFCVHTSDLMLLLFCLQQTWSNVWFGHVSIFDDIIIISSKHVIHIWTFAVFLSSVVNYTFINFMRRCDWLSLPPQIQIILSPWTHFCRRFFKLSELRVTSVFSACSSHPAEHEGNAAWSRICLLVSLPFGQSCK